MAIDLFNAALRRRGLSRANSITTDFPSVGFGIVLALSVVHHLQNFEIFRTILHGRMAPGGVVLTNDPLQTACSAHRASAVPTVPVEQGPGMATEEEHLQNQ